MRCAEALSGSLSKVDASVRVGGVFSEAKQIPLTYDPSKITLHQLLQAVAETPGIHGRPYQGGVLVKVEDPVKSEAKVKKALKQVKNVVGYDRAPGSTEPGEIFIVLGPLPRQAKPTDFVKASQIAEALEKAGVKFSELPTSTSTDGDSKKKQPAGKGSVKSKAGEDDAASEKPKTTKPAGGATKSKPTREPSSPAKSKDEPTEDAPRFQILAVAGEKVYLVDHETKNDDGKELKKFVKQGDKFGDYVVKEMADKDGWYVLLENAETKETVRVELERKDKEKDGDKPKTEKDKDAKEKDGDKEQKDDKKEKDKN